MDLDYELLPEDFITYCQFMMARRKRWRTFPWHWGLLLLPAWLLILGLTTAKEWDLNLFSFPAILTVVILAVILLSRGRSVDAKRMLRTPEVKRWLGFYHLSLTADGVTIARPSATTTWHWSGIRGVESTPELIYFFFFIAPNEALIVPRRAFADDGQYQEFMDQVRHFHEGTKPGERRPPAQTDDRFWGAEGDSNFKVKE